MPAKTEHHEQALLVSQLRLFHPELLIAAVPNGAAVSALQRIRLVSEGVLPGFPDLMLLEPSGGFYGLFIELKRKKEYKSTVSQAQQNVMQQLQQRGYAATVAYGQADAYKKIQQYLAGEVAL